MDRPVTGRHDDPCHYIGKILLDRHVSGRLDDPYHYIVKILLADLHGLKENKKI